MRLARVILAIVAGGLLPLSAAKTIKTVCPAGCDYTKSTFQAGLNASQPGWIFELAAGEQFDTSSFFILPAHPTSGDKWVQIRSSAHRNFTPGQRVSDSETASMAAVCTSSGGSGSFDPVFENRGLNLSKPTNAVINIVEDASNISTINFGSAPKPTPQIGNQVRIMEASDTDLGLGSGEVPGSVYTIASVPTSTSVTVATTNVTTGTYTDTNLRVELLNGSGVPATYWKQQTLTQIACVGNSCTLTSNKNLPGHVAAGQPISIRGVTGDADLNGDFIIDSVTSTTIVFTTTSVANNTYSNGGIVAYQVSSHWKLGPGLEIRPCAAAQLNGGPLINIGYVNTDMDKIENRPELQTHHIVVDQNYIHGFPRDWGPQTGIRISGNHVEITNNKITEIHVSFAQQESHGIDGSAGLGDFVIRNNEIGAATENIIFGGSNGTFDATTSNIQIIGNYFYKPAEWITFNYEDNPEGNTPPVDAVTTQTFHDLDDNVMLMWVAAAGGWVQIYRTSTSDAVCRTGTKWRNMSTNPPGIWDCVGGFWQSGGAEVTAQAVPNVRWKRSDSTLTSISDSTNTATVTTVGSHGLSNGAVVNITGATVDTDLNGTYTIANASGSTFTITTANVLDGLHTESTLVVSTVIPGNPTVMRMLAANGGGTYHCLDWFLDLSCTAGELGAYVDITGGTGDCTAINAKWRITFVDSSRFSVAFNSTGLTGCNSLTIVPEFIGWAGKNSVECKNCRGVRYYGNIIDGISPRNVQGQHSTGFLFNSTANQGGPDDTLQDITAESNIVRNVLRGVEQGAQHFNNAVAVLTPGVYTRFTHPSNSNGLRDGELVYVTGGTGDCTGINGVWSANIVGTGSDRTMEIPFNSTGICAGQALTLKDALHVRPYNWPRGINFKNNLFEVADPSMLTDTGSIGTVTTGGANCDVYSVSVGMSMQIGFGGEFSHNTFIKRGMGDHDGDGGGSCWLNDLSPFLPSIQGTIIPSHYRMFDNIFDGSAGAVAASATADNCNDNTTTYWGATGGSISWGGNVGGMAGFWQDAIAKISDAEYGNDKCDQWGTRAWDRSGTSFPTTETDNAVTVTSGLGTLAFTSAARLRAADKFCITSASPSNIVGCYVVPSGVTETSTSWVGVAFTGVPNNTYTSIVLTSVVGFNNYATGDYSLASGSMYKRTATDGGDPGADLSVVGWATAGAVSGAPNPYLDIKATWQPNDTGGTLTYVNYDNDPVADADIHISTSRGWTNTVGGCTVTSQVGRAVTATCTGLTGGTQYYIRLENMTGGRYYVVQ